MKLKREEVLEKEEPERPRPPVKEPVLEGIYRIGRMIAVPVPLPCQRGAKCRLP